MDIDAFVAANQGSWWRLQQLTERARKISQVTPDELDELVHLYQRTGANLAHARIEYAADPSLTSRLTLLVGDAHGVLYGQRDTEVKRGILQFATVTFPAAIYGLRRFILVAALLTFVPWAVFQIWLSVSPTAFDVAAPDAAAQQYIEQDFEDYYSNQPSQNFATQVFLNNIRVGFLAFAAGILLCVVTAALLAWNGANGGKAGGLFTHVGQADKFWGLILPHGMIELSAVVVAGAAGLRMGWAMIDPGDRPRFHAITDEARRLGSVLVGLVVAFLLAAIVEGFVTGRPWPTSVRVGIGVFVFVLFWGWTIAYVVRLRREGGEQYSPDAPI
ncbi:MAG: stage II sporulation protein M [Actinomycetota bacterium]|nr:stage II sporulation protein M [Actinomycetota bacterium]